MIRVYTSVCFALFLVFATAGWSQVQYSNDFNNPSSEDVSVAWPEWIQFDGATDIRAVNDRIEWVGGGGNVQWMRLDHELPQKYVIEFDFFHPENVNSRFSVWPIVKPGESIADRHNYFLRENTHYYNLADTIPSEGPRNMNLPVGAPPHRLRFEVDGDHVVFLYKDRGQGGFILVDERDFPPFGEGERYFQLGNNHDSGPSGVHYIDNIVISYSNQNLFNYSNNFNNATSEDVTESWSEWVQFDGATDIRAVNDRVEWVGGGGNVQWMRLDRELPENFVMEFDFFHPENVNSRFSVWPLVMPGESIADRHNYFLRENTHYYNLADTVPSEGPRNMNLPIGAPPHRLRFEVTGDHVVFLYKDRGEGGFILVDERDFPPFGDGPRYIQLGNNHDSGPSGVHYIDNFEIRGLADNRAVVDRSIGVTNFEPNSEVPVSLQVTVTGNIPSMTITEGIPPNWSVNSISHGGVISGGNITWSFTNQSESVTLTYNAVPPRLIQNRVAGFSGSADSGFGDERITGDTAVSIQLPYLYREAIDIDFSGSPIDGRNYPLGIELGERYTQGQDGIPSDTVYARPGGFPTIDSVFDFPAGEDFHYGNPAGGRGDTYVFDDYRDQGEIIFEHGASDTNAGVGSDTISAGDWFRYTFDFGPGDQVLLVNLSINTWGQGDCNVDLYVDNLFKGEFQAIGTNFNAYNFYTVGPFEVTGGEHSIVLAIPGVPNVPDSIGRIEVVRVQGIGRVNRQLTADGFFGPGQPINVGLTAQALYGTYDSFIEETVPPGVTVSNISDGGQQIGNKIIWDVAPTQTTTSVDYTVSPPEGARFLLFNGFADTGLPLADTIKGDSSVVNEVWIFGDDSAMSETDDFDGNSLGAPWFVEYGSDPSLAENYEDGVVVDVSGGVLTLSTDPFGSARFDEWANGRRAPMILRDDIPDGDWRFEAEYSLVDVFTWIEFHGGLTVTYNEAGDADVSNDEYLFGFYADEIRVELTNFGSLGDIDYHNFTDEFDWIDAAIAGDITAKLAVTKRGDELIFSAQLPDRPWTLVGPPVFEPRTPTRIGFFSKVWGTLNYSSYTYDSATLSTFDAFTDVSSWELY